MSTAAISVRGLDHAGIYGAFQYVGTEAADRLVAKLDLLGDAPATLGRPGAYPPLGDPERRARFDGAQQAKRSARYAESRVGFEAVVTSAPAGGDALARMADDELRYSLPVYEAQQTLDAMGRGPIGGAVGPEATRQPSSGLSTSTGRSVPRIPTTWRGSPRRTARSTRSASSVRRSPEPFFRPGVKGFTVGMRRRRQHGFGPDPRNPGEPPCTSNY